MDKTKTPIKYVDNRDERRELRWLDGTTGEPQPYMRVKGCPLCKGTKEQMGLPCWLCRGWGRVIK